DVAAAEPWVAWPLKAAAEVRALTFTPDGHGLAAGCEQGFVSVWHLEDGEWKGRSPLRTHGRGVTALAASAGGPPLAAARPAGKVVVWAWTPGKQQGRWQPPAPVASVALTPDGRYLAASAGNGTVCILRLGPPAGP